MELTYTVKVFFRRFRFSRYNIIQIIYDSRDLFFVEIMSKNIKHFHGTYFSLMCSTRENSEKYINAKKPTFTIGINTLYCLTSHVRKILGSTPTTRQCQHVKEMHSFSYTYNFELNTQHTQSH